MIGIALIYFIWKYYTELAFEYNKNRWGYFFLGLVSYYGSQVIVGLLIGVYGMFYGTSLLDDDNSMLLNLVGIPIGLLGAWGVYKLLEKKWKNEPKNAEGDTIDSELIQ